MMDTSFKSVHQSFFPFSIQHSVKDDSEIEERHKVLKVEGKNDHHINLSRSE